jgi:prepilin-type N-terminal cleavage/methylation domain-containing protein
MTIYMCSLNQIKKRHIDKTIHGFSLIEMAIVMFILALLLGGLLPTVSGQIELQHRKDTRKQMDEIQQAIFGFAFINGRLPCPADGSIPTLPGVANGAGQEKPICTAITTVDVLPWMTLGLSETDAWGRRFTYRVTPDFADAIGNPTYAGCAPTPIPTQASFALCSIGSLDIGLTTAPADTAIATNVPAVVISHGTNGLGAYTTAGQLLPGALGDEADNAANTTDNHFVSHESTPTFDDLVVWISPNILFNRMVTAGKLP